jgi:hypothetical protein
MKKAQLLSVVFSLIMFTGLTAGTAVAYAESDDNDNDFDDRLEHFCEMTSDEKDQLFEDYPRLVEEFEERLTNYCDLDEDEREELIDEFIAEHFPNYEEHDDWDMDDILDRYCEMSVEDKAAFVEKYPMASDHQDKMQEYCSLDESERDAFIEEHKDDYMKHDYDKREMMDKFCEMSVEDRAAHLEDYQKSEDHLATMQEYCSLDESKRDAFIEEYKNSMKDKMSEHKDSMKDKISEHRDDMKDQISDHKDSMKSDRKSHTILRASTLTDEQKDDIKEMHSQLRDLKQSLRDKSIDDDTKDILRGEFMDKAKDFAMTWLSPRHQVSAGIDAQMVECREGFELVMKTSNASPICVKETTAEKLIQRGIAISAV